MRYASSLAVLTAVFVAGCGGSGGDSGPGNPPVTVPPPDLAISSGNSMQVLQVAYLTASESGDMAGLVTNTGMETLYSYLTSQTLDAGVSPSPSTMTASGTADSSELGGVVEYSTPTMFQAFDNDYPSSGELLVTGANGATVRLIVIDNVDIRIEFDSDGMAPPDETIDTTWVAFTS